MWCARLACRVDSSWAMQGCHEPHACPTAHPPPCPGGPPTSPVDRISGPSSVSAPANLSNGSTASFTATWFSLGSCKLVGLAEGAAAAAS